VSRPPDEPKAKRYRDAKNRDGDDRNLQYVHWDAICWRKTSKFTRSESVSLLPHCRDLLLRGLQHSQQPQVFGCSLKRAIAFGEVQQGQVKLP
jgi:hypothetical protein